MVMNYIYVQLSAALLAFEFALNKKYQALEGVSTIAGLRFNALSGFLSALIVWIFSGFQLEWSAFSLGLAFCMALCCITYSMIGFRILKQGGLALYSTFLMSGGILLPYIFGIVFLNEMLTPLACFGNPCCVSCCDSIEFQQEEDEPKAIVAMHSCICSQRFCEHYLQVSSNHRQ